MHATAAASPHLDPQGSLARLGVAIFESTSDGMAVASLDDGPVFQVNDALDSMGGWTRAEVLGRTVSALANWANP